ncbi:MAG: arginine--tRNA ligase, partial [Candidatus Micrarchaeia archaeon]
ALPCFTLSKQLKRSPNEIASELAEKIKSEENLKGIIEEAVAKGPYLNIFLRAGFVAERTVKQILSEKRRASSVNKRVMVEFSQPNTHKEFHIGHLRNVALGDAMVRLLRERGFEVIAANYIGDVGAHVAKSLWCILKFHKQELERVPEDKRSEFLSRVYVEATQKSEEAEKNGDTSVKEEIAEIGRRLEARDPELTKLWQVTREWSLAEFKRIYKELDVKFDVYFFESEVEERGKQIVKELLQRGIAKMSEGAIIMDLKSYGLDVFLLLRRDGTALYSTKDIALAVEKFEKFKIERSIYVVGAEQKMYFEQLFKTLELMGFKQARNCYHLAYGLVMLEEGKMSSRAGNVVSYRSFAERVMQRALQEVEKRHPEWSAQQKEETARRIAIGAMKFGMLNQDNNKPIIFNIERSIDFEGDTCAYVQYAYTRASSIIRKNEEENNEKVKFKDIRKIKFSEMRDESEKSLCKKLLEFESVKEKAASEYKPFLIPKYLLELAKSFNTFYNQCPIIKAESDVRRARLLILESVRKVIREGLNLCGVEVLESM